MGTLTELQQSLIGEVVAAIEASSKRHPKRKASPDSSRLRRDYDVALRLAEVIPTVKALEDFEDAADRDVLGWLLDFPFELAWAGMAFEATNLQRVWATICERANFLGDRAVLLARGGMKEETIAQIAELNKEFPDDIWVQIKIGDAWWALKDLDQAEERFRWALGTATEEYDQEGARERLIDLLEERGRTDEALELEEQSLAVEHLREALRDSPYLTENEIRSILSDRELFQPYLRKALERRASIGSVPEDPVDGTDLNAVFLLTELGDTSIIPDLITCLRMDERNLDLFSGDSLTEHLWLPFARVGHQHLGEILAFVTDTAANEYARGAAVFGVSVMHHFRPERRAEVIGFFESLLDHPEVFPTDYLGSILVDCGESGLSELAGRAEEFASRMGDLDPRDAMATADDVRKAFQRGAREDFFSWRARDVYGVNDQWRKWWESQEKDEVNNAEEPGLPEIPRAAEPGAKKIGRNDPCPCGSGKKYKKCHGK